MSDLAQHDQFIFDRALDYLRTVPDIRSGLTTVVRSAAATVGGDCASLFLVQHSTGTLEPYILVNVPPVT